MGGVNQVVKSLAREMQKAGLLRPLVLIADWDAKTPRWECVDGLSTVRWRIRPRELGMQLKPRLAYLLWERKFRSKFERFCLEHRVAAINPHYPGNSTLSLVRVVRGFKSPVPLIVSFHGSDVRDLKNICKGKIAEAWRELLLSVRAAVVVSADLGARMTAALGDTLKPTVIYNGVDADALTAGARAEAAQFAGSRVILSIGKFEHQKGQDILIKAFAALAQEHGDLKLMLVGASDSALPGLRAQCLQMRIADRVLFRPDVPHDQIAACFREATVFALPSRSEGGPPLVILEAGALGLPVVASRVGGIPEIITDGTTGVLVEPDNEVELARSLHAVLTSPAAARAMGERLRNRVLEHFTWSSTHAQYVGLLESVK